VVKIAKYEKKIDSKSDLDKVIGRAYEKCRKFFGEDIRDIKIYFCYSRKEFEKFVKRSTPEWLVGVSGSKEVVILSPSVFAKASNHPKSDFYPVLTHEVAHVFLNQLYGFNQPVWLREGIPGYIASQYKIREIVSKNVQQLDALHGKNSWDKTNNYPQAFHFTKYLIDSFGKKKILTLISTLDTNESYEGFSLKLRKAVDMTIENVFNNWLQSMREKTE